jgi:hypothetical protein
MQRRLKLASQLGCTITIERLGFAVHAAMVLIVIVLYTLTVAALETFLLGDESLSALEAAMGIRAVLAHDIYSNLRDRDGHLCCGGQDCRPVQVTVLPNGSYYLPTTNEIIPADMAAPSPDDRFHQCTYSLMVKDPSRHLEPVWENETKTRCFFAPMHSS